MMKEIEDEHKWRDVLCSWIGRINSVKMPILPKATPKSNAVHIKIPMAPFFFLLTEIEQSFFFSFVFFRATPVAYGNSHARG